MSRRRSSRRARADRKPPPAAARHRSPAARLKVSDPTDLLAVLPYLIGFHPEESVVTVLVRGGRVVLTARVDLPPPEHATQLGDELAVLAARQEAHQLVLVAYSQHADPAREVLGRLADRLGGQVADAIYIDGQRWWSLVCAGRCCPAEGRPYEIESHPLAAEAVLAGLPVRKGRADLQATLHGPDPARYPHLERQARELCNDLDRLDPQQRAALVDSTVARAVAGESELDEAELLQLAVLVTDLRLRDRAWALIERADIDQHLRLWSAVVAAVPLTLASGPLCLLGLAGWIGGDGALLNCCAERVELLDPSYTLGGLLADITARAVPPSLWDEVQSGLREEAGLLTG